MASDSTRRRVIDAPAGEWLDVDAVAGWLGLPVGTVEAMVKDGRFPQPVKFSLKAIVWPWRVVVAAGWLLEYGSRQNSEEKQ